MILTWLGASITIVLFLGSVAVFLRGSADKGTIESQARQIAALSGELALTNTKCDKLDTRVQALENENEVLRAAVSHSEEVRQLQIDVNELLELVRGLAS
jgi:septal ring factor EnvC (AmiA/AmiB activator)